MQARLARAMDAQALYALNREFNGEDVAGVAEIAEALDHNANEVVVVALAGDRVIGFLCAQFLRSMCYRDPVGQISELYVQEDYRRRGAARAMMDYTQDYLAARGVKELFLLTGRDNVSARAFYESCGYAAASEQMYEKRI